MLEYDGTEREMFGGDRATTNNRMELTAVIEALAALNRPSQVILHTDSQYVMKGISEWIKGWKVKGHSGHNGNERADALANKGVESLT